ncbi:MAG: hypothetical protein M3Y22_01510, partial [Pseudomonadota bacterium]|nr:hypothetical protein [Pseudomonadota bacterium]
GLRWEESNVGAGNLACVDLVNHVKASIEIVVSFKIRRTNARALTGARRSDGDKGSTIRCVFPP